MPFVTLQRAAHAFFRSQVRLRLRGGVRLELQDHVAAAPAPSREEIAAARAQSELECILHELAAVLDEEPEIRGTLRHLVFVEQALQQKGLRALYKVPLDVLRRAHEQFEGLVTNWSAHGLASLRSKMAVAVIDRERQDDDVHAAACQTAAVLDAGPPQPADRPQGAIPDRATAKPASKADKITLRQV